MLALSVAVPLMERADLDHNERWESGHDPAACAPAHDHKICTQVGANLSLPSHPGLPSPQLRVIRGSRTVGLGHANRRLLANGNPTRAPPSV